jgi:hypothetical protein
MRFTPPRRASRLMSPLVIALMLSFAIFLKRFAVPLPTPRPLAPFPFPPPELAGNFPDNTGRLKLLREFSVPGRRTEEGPARSREEYGEEYGAIASSRPSRHDQGRADLGILVIEVCA